MRRGRRGEQARMVVSGYRRKRFVIRLRSRFVVGSSYYSYQFDKFDNSYQFDVFCNL